MDVEFVGLYSQYQNIKEEIDSAIRQVIRDSAFIKGEHVTEFEDAYSEMLGSRYCIGVANGTDAIYIALKSLGIGTGDEVITVANSWISTSEAIGQTGATPVFVDIEEKYFNINTTLIEEKITDKTRAIIPVHLFGQPAQMDEIMRIAGKHNLYVIEDCAQAHFATYRDKYIGTFGDVATFSFYPGKNLGAYGDAGAIVTNNPELARKMRVFANHGALIKHQHEIEGINSRLDGMQAAVLNVKLKHILKWNELRGEKAKIYEKHLSDIPQVTLPETRKNASHVYHVYCILTENRDKLKEFLTEAGIQTVIHYPKPLPFLEPYKYLKHDHSQFPVASVYASKLLSLPIYPEISEEEIVYVSEKIRVFF